MISKAVIIYTRTSHFIMVSIFCIHPTGQYLEPLMAAITAAGLLQYISIRSAHLYPDIFAQLSWQNFSSSVRLDREHL